MNPIKAMQLLDLPSDVSVFEGQIQKKTTFSILWIETNDYRTGKKVTTNAFGTMSSTQAFGAYAFNLISNYIHAYSCTPIGWDDTNDEYTLFKEAFDKTITQGQFAGLTYHFPWQKAVLSKSESKMIVLSDPFIYTNSDGTPTSATDPWILVQKQVKTITQSGTTTGSRTAVRIKASQFKSMSGWSDLETAINSRTEFPIVKLDATKFITSIAMDIEHLENNQFKGVFHVNGVPANTLPLSTMLTSYGKFCPSYVFQWRLYNSANATDMYGATKTVSFTASASNVVTCVSGSTDGYDTTTKTFTYDANLPTSASLLAYAEFLPAQGKNENAGRIYNLETMTEKAW
jgi:hypothetical protein